MRILHTEGSKGWGGQEIRILREAQGMRERGHFVALVVEKGGALAQRAREAGFTVYEVRFRRPHWPYSLCRLLWILHKEKIDLINTHSSLDSWLGGIAGRLAGKRLVRTRHLSTPIKPGFNSRFVYGTLADFVVTTCSSIVPMIQVQSGKNAQQCRSIATGVDPAKIQTSAEEVLEFRKRWRLSNDFVIGTACFMRSWKGIDDLLKAADLLRHIPHLKWMIIGGGHAERHHRLAQELKLDHVIFTGHLENPFPALQSLDVFALLSTAHEGVSQAILQAAYLEKPLLSTRTGGLAEVCIDGMTGFNVPAFAPQDVAQAVLQLRDDPALRTRFGKEAKALVLKHFTFTHTLNQMEEVYGSLRV